MIRERSGPGRCELGERALMCEEANAKRWVRCGKRHNLVRAEVIMSGRGGGVVHLHLNRLLYGRNCQGRGTTVTQTSDWGPTGARRDQKGILGEKPTGVWTMGAARRGGGISLLECRLWPSVGLA